MSQLNAKLHLEIGRVNKPYTVQISQNLGNEKSLVKLDVYGWDK